MSEKKLTILKKHYREYYKDSFPEERLDQVVELAMSIKEETKAIMNAMEEYAEYIQPCAVWVKASTFKTHKPVYRPYRKPCTEDEGEYDYGEIYVTEDDGRIYLDIDNESNYEHQSDERWRDYEILDESATAAAPLTQSCADLIREVNNRDMDGVAAGREGGNKDREVSILRWLRNEGWGPMHNTGWQKHADGDSYYLTDSELWNEWNNQKQKP